MGLLSAAMVCARVERAGVGRARIAAIDGGAAYPRRGCDGHPDRHTGRARGALERRAAVRPLRIAGLALGAIGLIVWGVDHCARSEPGFVFSGGIYGVSPNTNPG